MKKEKIDLDRILDACQSKITVKSGTPSSGRLIYCIFILVLLFLMICFMYSDTLTVNQITILGIVISSIISLLVVVCTLHNEKRADYILARKSALMMSEILESVFIQIQYILDGVISPISYPKDWIHYYEKCCTYLDYDYLPYLLSEFDIVEKINKCIESNDDRGAKRLLEYRRKNITDRVADFDIFSAKANLDLFASGQPEQCPWKQQKEYKNFKRFMLENYCDEIKRLTVEYLKAHDERCDANDAEYYVMEWLRKEKALQTGVHKFMAMTNRAMLSVIFRVYLSLSLEDEFSLCWGELCLKTSKKN